MATATDRTVLWTVRPATYTVRMGLDQAARVAEMIRSLTSASVTGYLDRVEAPEHGEYGEVILTLRATTEHDAKRITARILAKVGIEIEVDNA